MKIKEKIETIKIETYIAKDGKEFEKKHECVKHENELTAKERIKNIPHKRCDFREYGSWYYISSEEEYNALVNYIQVVVQRGVGTSFNGKYINDWVSYNIQCCLDYADQCEFISLQEIKEGFENLKESLKQPDE